MKKYLLSTILLTLAVTLAACGSTVKDTEKNIKDTNPAAVQNQTSDESNSPGKIEGSKTDSDTAAPKVNPADKSTVSGDKGGNAENPTTKQGSISVITKSDNAVSSVEKEKVLKDLDSEINGMIKDIDNLDEISDSDLAE
ncbi:MAG: hypothetical protein ACM3UU_09205 [Ignavibacteriales bacterium]